VRARAAEFDAEALFYPWRNEDPWLDELSREAQRLVAREERSGAPRLEIFRRIWDLAGAGDWPLREDGAPRDAAPHLTEAWYCCAEPEEGLRIL